MITDHGGVNKQAVSLAQKLDVTPEDNDVSKQLKSGADQNVSARASTSSRSVTSPSRRR